MKKQGSLFALTAAVLAVSLCGCGNVDGAVSPANSGGAAALTSEIVSGLTDSSSDLPGISGSAIVVNSDIGSNTEFPGKCKIYKASSVKFTDEQLFDFFNARPECGTPQKSQYYTDEYHRYEADGCLGYINCDDCFLFQTDTGSFYDSVHYFLAQLDNPGKKYMSTYGDLDFASRDEALKAVQTELSERFGIMPDEWWAFEFDAVKKEGVEEFKKQAYRNAYEPEKVYEGDDREKEKQQYERIKDLDTDDYYYFNIKYKADNIPIFQGGLLDFGEIGTGRVVCGTMSYLVYGRNGIEYILISPAYKVGASSEYTELIPADRARGLLQKKYDDLITDKQIEVLDMNLSYLPIPQNTLGEYGKNFELRPYYGFCANETEVYEGKTYSYKTFTYFDAVTGEELASVQGMEDIGREWGFDV